MKFKRNFRSQRKWLAKNPSIKSGLDFEKDVDEVFFPDSLYETLHRTPAFDMNQKQFDESLLKPDFQFKVRDSKTKFWVECKHRENNYDESVVAVFKPGQLQRYKSYANSFLILCTYYYDDELIFFVPFSDINWDNLYLSFLNRYEITLNPPIWPRLVEKYII